MNQHPSNTPIPVRGVPPFAFGKERYDQSTFMGRVRTSYSNTDARTLFTSNKELDRCRGLLDAFKHGTVPKGTTDADMWHAKKVTSAILHPDTQEPVFPLFRFSAFAPVNVFITTVMLLPQNIASFGRTAVIHSMNQSFNASINYANRNASTPVDEVKLAQGFAGAVTSSVSVALVAAAAMKRASALGNPRLQTIVRSTLPFLAVSSASCINLILMRRDEMTKGVKVFDEEGTERGVSATAGTNALQKCCAARVFWTIPGMIGPPVLMSMIQPRLPKNPRIVLLSEVLVITACLWIGVPPALAIFPQKDAMEVSKLEPQFQNLTLHSGLPVDKLYFNKGL